MACGRLWRYWSIHQEIRSLAPVFRGRFDTPFLIAADTLAEKRAEWRGSRASPLRVSIRVTTMSIYDEWNRLSARIRGLVAASELSASLFAKHEDAYGTVVHLGKLAHSITAAVNGFGASLDLSERLVKQKIHDAVERVWSVIDPASGEAKSTTTALRQNCILSAVVTLSALETEVSYLLFDRQSAIRLRTERAFEHLQRSIVVDETVRQRWKHAFESDEVECEKLGAVHLLGHGIWAFKANAAGGRTDLVYQEPLHDLVHAMRSSEGLVLTEWKREKAERQDVTKSFEQARTQAKAYASGVLAGTELTRVRYAVVVSEQQVEIPDDLLDGNITYRHINVAVSPRVPSGHRLRF